MIDVEQIKSGIDCRDLIARDIGPPKYRSKRTYMYRCPLHRERKGYSFAVYDDHWQCFGKCDRGGDAIAWLQEYHHLTFQEACIRLASGHLPQIERHLPHPETPAKSLNDTPAKSEPPDAQWRKAADKVANIAMNILWGKEGKRAWHYLEQVRGLSEDTIVNAGLGYIPGHHRQWREIEGLNVPCGITIPWYADHIIWGIKVRRAAGQQRYQQVAGGNISSSLYLADTIQPGLPVLITEGEIDALTAQQAGKGLIHAVAIGSAANTRINPRWYGRFIAAPSLLICMDADPAGENAASQLMALSQAARRVSVPQGKDLNEFYLISGCATVRAWLASTSIL